MTKTEGQKVKHQMNIQNRISVHNFLGIYSSNVLFPKAITGIENRGTILKLFFDK